MDMQDRLSIKVVDAVGLRPPPGKGSVCNPAVVVTVGNEVQRTKTLTRQNDPEWKSDDAMIFFHVAETNVQHAMCTVMHKDPQTGRELAIGQVAVPLATALLSPGIAVDQSFVVSPAKADGDEPVAEMTARLRVLVTYFLDDDFGMDEEGELAPLSKNLPNCLEVTVAKARNLRPLEGKSSVDAYVTIHAGGSKHRTKVEKNNTSPRWDHECKIPVTDGSSNVEIKVKHRQNFHGKVLGVCRIPMVEIATTGASGLRRWFTLLPEGFEISPEAHGEVELTLTWVYNKAFRAARATSSRRVSRAPKKAEPSNPLLEEDESEKVLSFAEREALEEAKMKRLDEAKKQVELYEANVSELKTGDYQLQVHILQATDLKGESATGLSNPYVSVKCLGKTQHTTTKKQVSGAAWDEKLFFNFKNLEPSHLQEAEAKVVVRSRNLLTTPMIGCYQFNLLQIYGMKDHELYDSWVALTDPSNEDDVGIQGNLRLSLTLLGPGDKQQVHDPEKEYQERKEKAAAEPDQQLLGPGVTAKTQFLVVTVFWATDLPFMDFGLTGAGINAYLKVEFAGNPAIKTRKVYESGRTGLSPEFMEQLWIPVQIPTMSQRIAVSLWDSDFFGDSLVAHQYFDFKKVPRIERQPSGGWFTPNEFDGPPPQWSNLYGAPVDLRGRKAGKKMNTYPETASSYRGRVLLSMHVVTDPKSSEPEFIHKKDFDFDVPDSLIPSTTLYAIRASVLLGSEIPVFVAPNSTGAAQMNVVVEFGPQRLSFKSSTNRRGQVKWVETQEAKEIELPSDISQLPDVGIYLCREGVTVSFARIPAAKLLAQSFEGRPFWQQLQADHSRDRGKAGLGSATFPGAVLLRLGLGVADDVIPWRDDRKLFAEEDQRPYCLRCNIFQGKRIPAKDANGLIDPYVKVRFCGVKRKTRILSMTTDPLFYETLEFHELLPSDLAYAPEVVLQVWDFDQVGSNSQVGLVRFNLADAKVTKVETNPAPPPRWLPLYDLDGSETSGSLLCSFQLVAKRDANERFQPPAPIAPSFRGAYLELIALGVRDMKPYNFSHIGEPYVRFDVPSVDDSPQTFQTRPSKYPRGRDANFLQKEVLFVMLPENPTFAPQLSVRVFDRRLSGISSPLVGAASLSLGPKMPWNSEGFIPPQSQLFNAADVNEEEEVKSPLHEEQGADDDQLAGGDGDVNSEDGERETSSGVADASGGVPETKSGEPGDEPPAKAADGDLGTGTFFYQEEDQLKFPIIQEDALYIEERERQLREAAEAGEVTDEGGDGWLASAESDLLAQTPGAQLLAPQEDDYNLDELDIDFPTSWASSEFRTGRDWWVKKDGKELEDYLETEPFERYGLFRGVHHPNPEKSTLRQVGLFKGIIRVCETNPLEDAAPLIDMRAIQTPAQFVVRVYIIRGKNLQPTGGGLADPYIRLRLGKTKISDQSVVQKQTLDPSFYKSYELETTIPGPTSLRIELRDWQRFLPTHELIGATTVDLEDRWFHRRWQAIDGSVDNDGAAQLEPIEIRNLTADDSPVAQGQLEMWVEILPAFKAAKRPPSELFGPPVKKFELRIVCWKSMEVPKHYGEDLYCRFTIPNCKSRETDTHWKAKNGAGSWNYRIKFPVELPLKSPMLGTLNVQMWDRDIFSANDIISEYNIDLYPWYLKAYHRETEVRPFKEINDAIKLKQQAEGVKSEEVEGEGGDTEDVEGESEEDSEVLPGQDVYEDKEIDVVDASQELEDLGEAEEAPEDEEKAPLMAPESDSEPEPEEEVDEEEEAKEAINKFWDLLGLGKIADDAFWLVMTKHDPIKKRISKRGKLAISIMIVPEEEYEARPVGFGRDEPNTNPYLPPPAGRMSFSFNPFAVLQQLIGPKTIFCILCCCCFIICCAAFSYIGTYYVSIYTMAQSL